MIKTNFCVIVEIAEIKYFLLDYEQKASHVFLMRTCLVMLHCEMGTEVSADRWPKLFVRAGEAAVGLPPR